MMSARKGSIGKFFPVGAGINKQSVHFRELGTPSVGGFTPLGFYTNRNAPSQLGSETKD